MATRKKIKKEEKLGPVYLITGTDSPKVEAAARRLWERVIADSGTDINIDLFDALDHHASMVTQAANTLPFGEGIRLVMVRNIGAWRKADKDILSEFLADPPGYSCLALVGGGLRKNESLYRAVETHGKVLAFDSPRPSDFPAWAREQAALRHLKLDNPQARRLVTLAGHDTRAINTELDKLALYAGQGTVQMEDIEAICWISPEVRIWDLTDAIGRRDRPAVFRSLEALLQEQTAPNAVFFALARHIRNLFELVAARDSGEDASRTASAMGLKPFPARKLIDQSQEFTVAGLRQALIILSGLDADLKGRSEIRPELALEAALAQMLDAAWGVA